MNVIKFDIEVKKYEKSYKLQFWRTNKSGQSIKKDISKIFEESSDFTGEYWAALKAEWENLSHASLKNLNSVNFLVGYFTVNNTKVFLFELNTAGISGMNNISIQAYAFGLLPIEDILNETFTHIKKVLSALECSLIDNSHIYIYPYNSKEKDIESPDLKIKAYLNSNVQYKRKDYIRLVVVLIISIVSLATAQSFGKTDDWRVIFRALFGSGMFYIFIDVLVSAIIPYFSSKNKKSVSIKDLSSVIETTNEIDNIGKTDDLKVPNI